MQNLSDSTFKFGGKERVNVLEGEADRWEPVDMKIKHIRQFRITGRVVMMQPIQTFGSGNRLLKFVIKDDSGDDSSIVVKAWGDQATQYSNLIKSGSVYDLEALHVNQTRKEDYGNLTDHVCELSFSKETVVSISK